jgi:hypothetical protein
MLKLNIKVTPKLSAQKKVTDNKNHHLNLKQKITLMMIMKVK